MTRFASATPGTRAALIAAGMAAGLAIFCIGTFLVALVGLGRFSGDIDPVRVPAWFLYYRHDPEVRRWLGVGAGVMGLILLILGTAIALGIRRPLHGAARWSTGGEQRRHRLRDRTGILLGQTAEGLLIAGGPDHVMLYAPTRTGKGVGVVVPNLLTWPSSVVVLDIKRENFNATAGFRQDAGQQVHLFDPLAPDGRTARFNPLHHIDRTAPIIVLDELQRIAGMLFPAHSHADPFWSEAARTGFIGVGAYVAATPGLPFTLGEIYRQLTEGDPRERFPKLLEERRRIGDPVPAGAASAVSDFCSSGENTFASIRQSITTRMGLWLNPLVDAATSASDFDLRDIRGGRLSLYLATSPENMDRVAPLYALLFQQLVDLNSRTLPLADTPPTLVLLDEFARLGRAPVLAHAFAWVAGYGLRLLPVIQSPSQLRALYGPDATEDILTNCGLEIVFAPKELKVAQELSERLGYYTYRARSRSRPIGLGQGRRSLTDSDQRRALMLPQELMQLSDKALIVLKAGLAPTRGRKLVYYRDRRFTDRLRPPPSPPPTAPRAPAPLAQEPQPPTEVETDMDFDSIVRRFTAEGLKPPPPGATEAEVQAWLQRVVTAPVGAPSRERLP
ncbi:MAG: type IV secretory system conjugative DNA transfer family protein [Alphaproteobacteria bacterium]|jgi:type IV secretion system protein VirD4|uniref:Type IV secretion system protein VirD4 n=1 Tax=Brevundimonas aurantiaca TaxID=74316 RepID=A0A7W9C3U4_9CAUL|nr:MULTISPECIES: type IV secretory system conjugative DNA transfer family protein [Brevundimonas]MBU1538842.1 type IV secretory system conjugative DNA transfer family protein [Alphaproteobacteria bacterium]ALJ09484.1 conjugal transfer protein TraG [Brevundimonas sp. DS20]MBB5738601.1 type IV secretion system protein VirD4 [Brevundimonas aurantiaca]MBU2042889.1 type IV secretory system conjugative DNA transfer family protein [Alphaproteobacteria bacterium]MBU2209736.1 type IV secretory system c